MRVRPLAPFLFAVIALVPTAAFAQQNPPPADGTSMNEPPAAGPMAAVDACGNPVTQTMPAAPAPGRVIGDIPATPLGTAPAADPNVDNVGNQMVNTSAVRGTLVHAEGNLMLLTVPMLPAAGNDNPVARTPDKTMAVVRLPANCALPSLTAGDQVSAMGIPTADGILNAESILAAQ